MKEISCNPGIISYNETFNELVFVSRGSEFYFVGDRKYVGRKAMIRIEILGDK